MVCSVVHWSRKGNVHLYWTRWRWLESVQLKQMTVCSQFTLLSELLETSCALASSTLLYKMTWDGHWGAAVWFKICSIKPTTNQSITTMLFMESKGWSSLPTTKTRICLKSYHCTVWLNFSKATIWPNVIGNTLIVIQMWDLSFTQSNRKYPFSFAKSLVILVKHFSSEGSRLNGKALWASDNMMMIWQKSIYHRHATLRYQSSFSLRSTGTQTLEFIGAWRSGTPRLNV